MDRSAWRLAINVSEPWHLFVLCHLWSFMCLPVSRLFWVSSLAYPNLLGTKDYVVVVVQCQRNRRNPIWSSDDQIALKVRNQNLKNTPENQQEIRSSQTTRER
jgi:hypothetical protein